VLPEELNSVVAHSEQNDVPVIVGSNANEMTTLTLPATWPKSAEEYRKRIAAQYGEMVKEFETVYPISNDGDATTSFLGSARDVAFTLQMRTWARLTGTGRSKAYLYFFSHVPPGPNSKYLGAYHASEIAYAFDNLNPQNAMLQELDHKLA